MTFKEQALNLQRYIRICVVVSAGAVTWAGTEAAAQTLGSDQHSITIQVSPMSVVQVTGGAVSLSLASASVVAGQDEMTVTDQSSGLAWGTNSSSQKITVSTSLTASLYTLKVVAVNPTAGLAAPEVTLGTVAGDLLLNIGRSSGFCALRYTGIALASQGTGTDVHTITFTVQTQ